jgi:hypothetical protein
MARLSSSWDFSVLTRVEMAAARAIPADDGSTLRPCHAHPRADWPANRQQEVTGDLLRNQPSMMERFRGAASHLASERHQGTGRADQE